MSDFGRNRKELTDFAFKIDWGHEKELAALLERRRAQMISSGGICHEDRSFRQDWSLSRGRGIRSISVGYDRSLPRQRNESGQNTRYPAGFARSGRGVAVIVHRQAHDAQRENQNHRRQDSGAARNGPPVQDRVSPVSVVLPALAAEPPRPGNQQSQSFELRRKGRLRDRHLYRLRQDRGMRVAPVEDRLLDRQDHLRGV